MRASARVGAAAVAKPQPKAHTASMQSEDEPRPDPQPGAAGAADWLDVVVPDDARALERDVADYHRELRSRRRAVWFERVVLRRWRRLGFFGPLALGLTIAILAVGSLLLMALPRPQAPRPAQQTIAPAGTPGLVPDIALDTGDVAVGLRGLRPAVVVLVPAGCKCGTLLDTLAGQAQEFHLDLLAVGPPGSAEVFDLVQKVRRGTGIPFVDGTGTLARTYAASGVTVLLLAPDATVRAVVRNAGEHTRLEPYLTAILQPGTRTR